MIALTEKSPTPLAQPDPDARRAKVFAIGLNKTGTTSLKLALEILGYRTSPNSKALMRRIRRGHVAPAIEHTRKFDAFQDWPWPLIFRELFEEYGHEGRYILTRRSSFEKWFASVENHARSSRLFSGQRLAYGYYRPFGRERVYREIYDSHNEAVRSFFATGPGAGAPFLEMCLDHGDGWEQLCSFLNCDVVEMPFPHKNTAANRKDRWRGRRAVNSLVEPVYKAYVKLSGGG